MKTKILSILTCLFFMIVKPLSAVVIEGKILNYEEEKISLKILFGQHYLHEREIEIKINESGEFYQEVEVKSFRFATLIVGDEEIGLFLEPAATGIRLTLDNKNPAAVQFEGEKTNIAAFANYWLKKRAYLDYESISSDEKSTAEKFYSYCDDQLAKELHKLESLKEEMNPQIYDLWEEEIRDYFLALKIHGGLHKGYIDQSGKITDWIDRNENLFSMMSCDHKYNYVPSYNYLLGYYEEHSEKKMEMDLIEGNTEKWFKAFDVENMDELSDLMGKDSYNMKLYELGKEWTCQDGFIKALATRILRSQRNGDYENLYWLYEKFVSLNPPIELKETIDPLITDLKLFESKKAEQIEGINFYPKKAFETGILPVLQDKNYRGKVLLVDIWGTWCGPCREEFPYLKELKKSLAKEKDIAYLYLSAEVLKNPEQHWIETVKYFDLKGDHYLVTKELLTQFKMDINILFPGTYPTYMIIDRKGKVAIAQAAYPSDGDKLLKQIEAVLKEE